MAVINMSPIHLAEDRCVIDSAQVKRMGYEYFNLVHAFEKSYAIDFLGTSDPLLFSPLKHRATYLNNSRCDRVRISRRFKVIPLCQSRLANNCKSFIGWYILLCVEPDVSHLHTYSDK